MSDRGVGNWRTHAYAVTAAALGAALFMLGRELMRAPFRCGDPTCTEAHP